MHPAKVLYEKSLTEIERDEAQKVLDIGKNAGLRKFFNQPDTCKTEIIANSNKEQPEPQTDWHGSSQEPGVFSDSAAAKPTSSINVDSDLNYTDESDVTESNFGSSQSSGYTESPRDHEKSQPNETTSNSKCTKAFGSSREIKSSGSSKPDDTALKRFIRQLQTEAYTPTETESSFLTDLLSKISLANFEAQNNQKETNQVECSTFEFLDVESCWTVWDYENQSRKLPLEVCIGKRLNEHAASHLVHIKFGRITFHCHRIVLRFAQLFREFERKIYQFHPTTTMMMTNAPKKLTTVAFVYFYQFALGIRPKIAAEHFYDVLQASELLNVPLMRIYCIQQLDSPFYHEYNASVIFKAAKHMADLKMQRLMLQRIWRFFLPFVATKSFLELDVNELCRFLSADTIGVNSEIEVFYAAILWLNAKWRKRKGKTLERVMNCIRFCLLPPWFTYSLKRGTGVLEVDRVLSTEFVTKMIEDGASIAATISLYFVEPEKFERILQRLLSKVPKQRAWVFDRNCTYHYGAHEKVTEAVDYIVFNDYLRIINMEGQNYWRHFQEGGDNHLKLIFSQKFSDLAWAKMQF